MFQYSILIISALLGGGLVFAFKKLAEKYLQLVLSFSGAFLFGITVLHLLPDIYQENGYQIGIFIIAGFIIQLLLEQFSKGAEHGHIHKPEAPFKMYFIGIFFGLTIHAFLEGVPLANNEYLYSTKSALLYGIAIHKIPAAFALTSILFFSTSKKAYIIGLLIAFSLMSPLGLICGNAINTTSMINFDLIMAIVIGSFLHISTTILFESEAEIHRFNIFKMVAILAGIGIALLT